MTEIYNLAEIERCVPISENAWHYLKQKALVQTSRQTSFLVNEANKNMQQLMLLAQGTHKRPEHLVRAEQASHQLPQSCGITPHSLPPLSPTIPRDLASTQWWGDLQSTQCTPAKGMQTLAAEKYEVEISQVSLTLYARCGQLWHFDTEANVHSPF